MISAAFLFQFGTGPIRGFAMTLSLGLLSNLFTSIFVSKTLFELELSRADVRRRRSASETSTAIMHIFTQPEFQLRPLAVARASRSRGSSSLAGAGHHLARKGMPLGVEFSGGTIVIVQVRPAGADNQQVRDALDRAMPGGGQNAIVQQLRRSVAHQVMIRVPHVGAESGGDLSKTADAVVSRAAAGATSATSRSPGARSSARPSASSSTRQGTLATVLALGGILLYIAFRFQFSFAVGAVVATIHDLLITLAFLAFFRYDLTLERHRGAADDHRLFGQRHDRHLRPRPREHARDAARQHSPDIVNAVGQPDARPHDDHRRHDAARRSLALFFFGGEVLQGFAFTMIVGIITGTYSSVFIAAAIVVIWQGHAKRPRQAVDVRSGGRCRPPPRRASRGRRRAS